MDEEATILQGKRYGEVGFMWHKTIAPVVKTYKRQNKRVCGLIMTLANKRRLLILNVYFKCDNYECVKC